MIETTEPDALSIETAINQTGTSVQRGLESVLLTYGEVRKTTPYGSHPQLWSVMEDLRRNIERLPSVLRHPRVQVSWSLGTGNWARVPWIALMDNRETASTQRGTYIVMLFREDLSGLYLALNQGVTDIIKAQGRTAGRKVLEVNAERMRSNVGSLRDFGFSVGRGIDLRTDSGLGRDYEHSTVAYKLYRTSEIPNDALIDHDLDTLLRAYATLLEQDTLPPHTPQRTWIFQGNPELFDIDGAVAGLSELSWLVNQHRDVIRRGDQVFLWRSGPNAGIVAVATVLQDPALLPENELDKQFDRAPLKFEGEQLRVRLRIDRKLETPLPRSLLISAPELKDLSIIRSPMGTNFPVTSEEAGTIAALIGAATPVPKPGHERVWVYAPGPNAQHWDEFYRGGIIAIGWDEIGDLQSYQSLEEMSEVHTTTYSRDTRPINDALACWEFATQMSPGDFVFARQGLHTVIGYGIVTGEYEWRPLRASYKSVRTIRWEGRGSWNFEPQFAVKTLTDITEYSDVVKTLRSLVLLDKPVAPPPPPVIELPPYAIDTALEGLFLDREEFGHILRLWRIKKNVIVQGPPGVGKTFTAKRLAYALMGFKDDSRLGMVQFHQSYSYEDFIQGYRPSANGFALKDGVFYEFCHRAQTDQDNKYVFVIDEINRGNLSKIFGELLMLIEADKRGAAWSVPLTYSPNSQQQFYVPPNLFLLGMMNTADRSLSMVDYALRRRFGFVTLGSRIGSERFARLHRDSGTPEPVLSAIISRLTSLNEEITGDTSNLGPGFCIGHSFFCPGDHIIADEEWYRQVIETEILPLLDEYWFDYPEKVQGWRERLLAEV
jgi:MoxR-like ATPase